jgi:hypothetical protein
MKAVGSMCEGESRCDRCSACIEKTTTSSNEIIGKHIAHYLRFLLETQDSTDKNEVASVSDKVDAAASTIAVAVERFAPDNAETSVAWAMPGCEL